MSGRAESTLVLLKSLAESLAGCNRYVSHGKKRYNFGGIDTICDLKLNLNIKYLIL